MFTENLSTLKIHKLSQAQYERELVAGNIDANALYLTPDENIDLTSLGVTATAAELNKLDGVTATTTELNYVDGVTSNIQEQLNDKAPSSHNHSASNITSGTMSTARLPTVPISKGGTGATTAEAALENLGIASLLGGSSKVAYGSYTGTGMWGTDYPTSLTFDFAPKAILFISNTRICYYLSDNSEVRTGLGFDLWDLQTMQSLYMVSSSYASSPNNGSGYGCKDLATREYNSDMAVTCSGNTVSWCVNYAYDAEYDYSKEQANVSGIVYRYIAFG